jgi:hypothetical protein
MKFPVLVCRLAGRQTRESNWQARGLREYPDLPTSLPHRACQIVLEAAARTRLRVQAWTKLQGRDYLVRHLNDDRLL